MDGLFYFAVFLSILLFLLFFPLFLSIYTHLDITQKKLGFAIYLYGKIKIIGGYATSYKGGFVLHLSKRKAILIPYKQMDVERKKFSFIKTFRPISLQVTVETGAEYLLPIAIGYCFLRAYFFLWGGKKEKIGNKLWLTDGDQLKISTQNTLFFNGYTILLNIMKFLKEKIKSLCLKKMKKSIV